MKLNKNSPLFSIVFTTVATIVLVFPLTLANWATKPIADDYWRIQRYVKTLKALGVAADASRPEQARQDYAKLEKFTFGDGKWVAISPSLIEKSRLVPVTDQQIDLAEVQGKPISPLFYVAKVDGQARFAGNFTGPGLWGNVSLTLGVQQSATLVTGLQVIYQVETPGLGGRISEPWFTEQFRGLKPDVEGVVFNTSGNKKPNGFDAITGATITSTAVKDIVNQALPNMKAVQNRWGGQP